LERSDLLAKYREGTEPDAEAVERALARVSIRIASEPLAAPQPALGRRAWLLAAGLLVLILAGLALAFAVGLGDSRELGRHEAEYQRVEAPLRQASTPAPVELPTRRGAAPVEPAPVEPAPVEPAPALAPVEPAPAPAPAPAPVEPRPRTRARTPEPEPEPAAPVEPEPAPAQPANDLADESHLLAKARRALTKHDWAAALEWAREHARRHPEGLLVEERLVIEAVAACHAGERERGLASLAEAERRFGPPAAKPEIEAACASD
jgi:hypothetical protein